ncbi:MAG TPA: M13 family metallopeptidase [Kofleriaceae bacterium]|jgi:putative endopeptidase
MKRLWLLVLAACSGNATPPPAAPAPAAPVASVDAAVAAAPANVEAPPGPPALDVSLQEVGLEASSLDRTADPCVDFYQFACGGWMAKNQIPADRARWGRLAEIDERNKAALQGLLDDDAKGTAGDAAAKKLGDFFTSCMDEAGIEKAGVASVQPLLDKASKVKDARSWLTAVIELHKAGIDVVWDVGAGADFKDSTKVVTQLDSGGLGLPERGYYLDAKYKDKLDAYTAHVGKMLALGKSPGSAADVIAIETELAKVTKTPIESRDVQASYNPTDLKGLTKQAKSVDWAAYFKGLGFAPSAKLVVGTPKFFAAIDALRSQFKPAQWATYFTYHALEGLAPTLPKVYDDEHFELVKLLTGVEQRPERFKRCIDATTAGLGEMLGKQYADKYFPAAAKQAAGAIVDAIVQAMHDDLASLDWMSPKTRDIAVAKLAKIVRRVGYPDKWKTYDFAVKRDDYAGNALRARVFAAHRERAKSGKPFDRSEWGMQSFTVNAYYSGSANNIALPAGILQMPFFGVDRGVAANMGGIGLVVGHELTHGFDDQGSQFDADGNLANWWQPDDKAKFDAKGTCVADQYSSFEAIPKGFVQGRLTLGENIADLGGAKMAFEAYRALRKNAEKQYVADGFTEDQQFFIGIAQAWCDKDRPAEIQRRLAVDPHSPPKFRVYGALRNLPEFATAFSCPLGTPMHPQKACSVW